MNDTELPGTTKVATVPMTSLPVTMVTTTTTVTTPTPSTTSTTVTPTATEGITTVDPPTTPEDSLTIGVIVGITIGGLVLLIIIILIICCCCRKKKTHQLMKRIQTTFKKRRNENYKEELTKKISQENEDPLPGGAAAANNTPREHPKLQSIDSNEFNMGPEPQPLEHVLDDAKTGSNSYENLNAAKKEKNTLKNKPKSHNSTKTEPLSSADDVIVKPVGYVSMGKNMHQKDGERDYENTHFTPKKGTQDDPLYVNKDEYVDQVSYVNERAQPGSSAQKDAQNSQPMYVNQGSKGKSKDSIPSSVDDDFYVNHGAVTQHQMSASASDVSHLTADQAAGAGSSGHPTYSCSHGNIPMSLQSARIGDGDGVVGDEGEAAPSPHHSYTDVKHVHSYVNAVGGKNKPGVITPKPLKVSKSPAWMSELQKKQKDTALTKAPALPPGKHPRPPTDDDQGLYENR